jgi:dTDP-4-dehydrorhamnose reductase
VSHAPAPPETWVVVGSGGQLGAALVDYLSSRGLRVAGRDSSLDVRDRRAVAALLEEAGPEPRILLNAAAYTDVDGCERDPERAESVNAVAPGGLAELCRETGTRFAHVSTDFVFDGRGDRPLREDDPVAPLSSYGRTKLAGERAVQAVSPDFLIVRTAWVFGRGRNFIAAICRGARERAADPSEGGLRVVADQVGSPTYAEDLARGLVALVERGANGLYHLANRGRASRFELARFVLAHAGLADVPCEPVKTSEYPLPAERPLYTVLDCARAELAGVTMRGWREAVSDYLDSDSSPLAEHRGT